MRTRILILALALTTTALVLVPNASAACEPLADPGYCTSEVRETVGNVVERVGDLRERIEDLLTLECEWDENGNIRCE